MEKMGDLFEPVLKLKQKLPKLPGVGKATETGEGSEIAAQAESADASRAKKTAPTRSASEEAAEGIIRHSAKPMRGRNMAQLYVGTSGWAYPSWKPDFYPAKLAQKKFLRHYATQLNTVEVNLPFANW